MNNVKLLFNKCIDIRYVLLLLTAERHGPAGQGYCQGGFSADFTKVREMFASFMQEHGQCFSLLADQSSGDYTVCTKHAQFIWNWWHTDSSAQLCVCFFQDGRVVLGGPGSFYWQGELRGMWCRMAVLEHILQCCFLLHGEWINNWEPKFEIHMPHESRPFVTGLFWRSADLCHYRGDC